VNDKASAFALDHEYRNEHAATPNYGLGSLGSLLEAGSFARTSAGSGHGPTRWTC